MFPNLGIPYDLIKDVLLLSYAIFSAIFFLGKFSAKINEILTGHISILTEINRNLTGINEKLRDCAVCHENRETKHTSRIA